MVSSIVLLSRLGIIVEDDDNIVTAIFICSWAEFLSAGQLFKDVDRLDPAAFKSLIYSGSRAFERKEALTSRIS